MQNPFEELFKEISLLRKCVNGLQKKLEEHIGSQQKQFFSPKEYCKLTGQNYKTVVNHCQKGTIKARQNGVNGNWFIHRSEIERETLEATTMNN